jgi:hypothetical protein
MLQDNPHRFVPTPIAPPPQFAPEAPDDSPIQQYWFGGGRGVLSLLVAIVVLVVAIVAFTDVGPLISESDAQYTAVRQFCASQARQDYAAAFGQFASAYVSVGQLDSGQYQLDLAQYTDTMTRRDQTDGPVQSCVVTGRDYPATFASALFFERGFVFQVRVTRAAGTWAGALTLVKDHGWKVRYLDDTLRLDR